MLVSAQPLILALFGGVGSLWGPVIGAIVLVPLAEVLNAELGDVLPGIQGVVYGVAIIAIILYAPEGVYWRLMDRLGRRRKPALRPAVEAEPGAAVIPLTAAPPAAAVAFPVLRDGGLPLGRVGAAARTD